MLKYQGHILEIIFKAIAILVVAAILLKAIIDIDPNYDVWWYHLPFAARIWGIVPSEMFIGDEKWFEPRFAGFPLLAHFLQGCLWRITGRIQSTNLVGLLALLGYFYCLKTYFQVPLYLSAIAVFTIPIVATHAATSFVDLFGNVGTSLLVMMTYRFYTHRQLPAKKELFIAFVGAAIAANTKTQLQPLVFLILIFTGARLIWLAWQQQFNFKLGKSLVMVLATAIIFASPLKNIVLYQNPFYPIKVEVAGIVLNHKLTPEAYDSGNRQQNWLESVLEINANLYWSADQWSADASRTHRGGFFGTYVVFNLLLLLGLAIDEFKSAKSTSVNARIALVTVLLMSIVPASFPQSHELRYFMFWMICLVSLNLALLSQPQTSERWRWLQPKYMGLIYLVFLTFVFSRIGSFYGKPVFNSLEQRLVRKVKPELLQQIEPNADVCLLIKPGLANRQKVAIESQENAFLYSSYFHPELDYDYSVQAALDPASCGERIIIPADQFN